MDKLVKWLEDLIRAQKKSRAWRTFVSCLAAIVVFTTTYSLILPAITVESTATEDVGGLVMEGTDAGSTGAQAEASGDVVTVNAENEIPEEPVQEEVPAVETTPAEETSAEETAAETPASSSETGTAQPAASQPQTAETAESAATVTEEAREPVNGEVQTIGDKRVMTLKGDDFDVVVSGDLSVGVSDRTVLSVRGITDADVVKSFSDRISDELLKIFVDKKTTEVLYQLVFTDENLVEYTPAGYFDVQFIFHRNTVSHTGEKIYAAIYDYLTDEMVLAEKNGDEYETPVISLDEYGIIKGITLKGMHFDEYSDIITLVAGPVNEELKLAAEKKAAEAAASESKAENAESADSKTEKTESADAKTDSSESKAEGPSAKAETSKEDEKVESTDSKSESEKEKTEAEPAEESELPKEDTTEADNDKETDADKADSGSTSADESSTHVSVGTQPLNFTINAKESFKLSEIAEVLKLAGIDREYVSGSDFVRNVSDVTFTNSDLVKVKRAGIFGTSVLSGDDWTIKGLRAYESEEYLTVTMKDGAIYSIRIFNWDNAQELTTECGEYTVTVALPESTPEGEYTVTAEKVRAAQDVVASMESLLTESLGNGILKNAKIDASSVELLDITIYKDGAEYEPEGPVQVNVRKADGSKIGGEENSGNAGQGVIHFVNQAEPEVLPVQDGSFTTESFSVFAVNYTVDFEYIDEDGNVISWSWPGGESVSIADIIEEIGIVGEIEDVTLERIEDKGGSDRALYLEKKTDGWYLTSDEAFQDVFLLKITVDGKKYELRVTDSTDNLNSLLTDLTVTSNDGTTVGEGGTVYTGRDYSIHMAFAEGSNESSQFATQGSLKYHVPDGIDISSTTGTFEMQYGGVKYGGNTYTYDPATRDLLIEFSPTVASLVRKSNKAAFEIDIQGSFNGQSSSIDWGNGQNKTYELSNAHGTSITKSGSYSSTDNKIHYTLTAKSTGKSENVKITDFISGTALTLDQDSITYKGNSTEPSSINKSDKGFDITFPSMKDNETITIEYTASVNLNDITGKGTIEQTGNSVKIKSDGEPEPNPVEFNVNNQIDYNPLKKEAGAATGDGMVKTVPWTITVNEQQLKSMAGTKITDRIGQNSSDIMSYSGKGITIAVMDGNSVIRTITKTWGELGVDTSSAKTWSYTLPNESDDRDNTYKYVISYTTDVDTTGKIADFKVNNTVDDGEGHNYNGEGTVGPGGEKVVLEKECTSFSAGTSSWKVTFTVPKAGLTKAVVTETLPNRWYNGGLVIDELYGDIAVDGTIGTESYDVDKSTMSADGKVIVTFYKTGEKTEANQGMLENDTERTITLTFTTKNNSDWVSNYPGEDHWNNVSLDANGQVLTDNAKSNPVNEGVDKTGFYAGTIEKNGKQYPIFHYTLSLYGVTEQSFLEDDGTTAKDLVVTDTFDNNYLELYTGYTDDRGWKAQYNQNQYGEIKSKANVSVDGNKITITSGSDEFETYSVTVDGQTNQVYRNAYVLDYYLIVKDEKLNTIKEQSLSNPIILHNEVTWDEFEDKEDIEYKYPVVDKEMLGVDKDTHIAKFKIVLNPDKMMLNGGADMTMTDSATNLSIDYSTLKFETDPAGKEDIEYYYSGHTGYFTIPDQTKVTITYDARVVGDGTVSFSNEAKMNGYSDETKTTETMTDSGKGNIEIDWVLVYKHELRQMNKALNGAVYVLTDEDGNPLLYPESASGNRGGTPITFTTRKLNLHELPDGLYVMNDGTYKSLAEIEGLYGSLQAAIAAEAYTPEEKDGYTWIYLDMEEDGMALNKGVTYYFKEYSAPDGFQKSELVYSFTIAEHPDYDEWEYYKGDILRFADAPKEGVLNIEKSFDGVENLSENQKEQIKFLVTGVDADGNAIKIPYGGGDQPKYAPVTGLEISYKDFENGKYSLEGLPLGTYTVKETAWDLSGYTYTETTYKVDDVDGSGTEKTGVVTITDSSKEHTVSYVNKYTSTGASLNVIKKNETGNIYLYGAKFQLSKWNETTNAWDVVNGTNGADGNGELLIGYENRVSGVTITDLTNGRYRLVETEAPNNYYKDGAPIYFSVSGNVVTHDTTTSNEHVTFENTSGTYSYTVKNDLKHTYELSKVDNLHLTKKLSGAEFDIYPLTSVTKTGDNVEYTFGSKVTTLTTGEDGAIEIDMRALGLQANQVYCVKESKAPAGYALTEKVYSFYYRDPADSTVANVGKLITYQESVVDLTNGPQGGFVPNTEDSMDLFVKKLWKGINNQEWSNTAPDSWGITSIEVKLYQQTVNEETGEVVSTKQYPDDETTYSLTLGGGGQANWLCYKWQDLPTGHSVNTDTPVKYKYYVEEVNTNDFQPYYILTTSETANQPNFAEAEEDASLVTGTKDEPNIAIVNTLKPLDYTAKKVWLDDEQNHGDVAIGLRYSDNTGTDKQPTQLDLTDPKTGKASTPNPQLNSGNHWTYHWEYVYPGELDNPRTYYVVETNLDKKKYTPIFTGPNETGLFVLTNVKKDSDDHSLKVKKVWLDSDETELPEPPNTPVTVQLERRKGKLDGKQVIIKAGGSERASLKVTPGTDLSFSLCVNQASVTPVVAMDNGTISDPEVIDNWGNITYKYTCNLSSINEDVTINITGTLGESVINWQFEVKDIVYQQAAVEYVGNAEDVSTDIVPESRVTLNNSNNWIKQWNNLPTDAGDGNTWFYSVREVNVPAGFEVEYENNDGITEGIMYVKNVKSQYTRAVAYKKWLDAAGAEIEAPADASVTFAIYQDGRRMAKTITLDGTVDAGEGETGETEPWVATWEGLEYYKADGETPHEYTILEATGMSGYTAMLYDPAEGTYEQMTSDETISTGGTIYNKKVRSIEVVKVWKDINGNEYTTLPEGLNVKINLYKNGDTTPEKSITLDGRKDVNGEQTPWKATFDNLDDTATYSISESDLPGNYKLVNVEGEDENHTWEQGNSQVNAKDGDSTITLVNQEGNKPVEVTKIWKNETNNNTEWPEGVTSITLKLFRKLGSSENIDTSFGTNGYVTVVVGRPAQPGITDLSLDPSITDAIAKLTYSIDPTTSEYKYLVKITGLPNKNGTEEYSYYFEEDTTNLSGYTPTYPERGEEKSAVSEGTIVNIPQKAVTLPSTGGPGTRFYYSLGIAFIAMAGIILFIKRKEMRSLRGEVVIPGDED